MDYEKQANDFLKSTNTEFKVEFLKYDKHFESDKENRDIYTVTLKRGGREFSFNFGQSINCSMQWIPITIYAKNLHSKENYPRLIGESKSKALQSVGIYTFSLNQNDFVKNENFSEPTPYDVLSCLTKYNPGTLKDFCDEFGYDEDSKKAEKTYNAVLDEYKNVAMLWNDSEIEMLTEIQ